jgi:hypothetical protein
MRRIGGRLTAPECTVRRADSLLLIRRPAHPGFPFTLSVASKTSAWTPLVVVDPLYQRATSKFRRPVDSGFPPEGTKRVFLAS